MGYRIGFSKDIHRLVPGRKLIIGGVVIPSPVGELAHSDGDVLFHALAESILGALALGDLGKHFPDNSEETKDLDSSIIVKQTVMMMENAHYKVSNVDIFIALEKPKLKDFIHLMRQNIASLLHCEISQVSVKAGTNESIGEIGKNEAIEATSCILLENECC